MSSCPVKAKKLTDKQKKFVEEYLIDLNATQACIRAGYSPKYADREGHKLVENSRVSEAIANAMAETTTENYSSKSYYLYYEK